MMFFGLPEAIVDYWVAEYSPLQKQWHIETVGEMILNNKRSVTGRCPADYVPLGFFEDDYEADEFIRKQRERGGLFYEQR